METEIIGNPKLFSSGGATDFGEPRLKIRYLLVFIGSNPSFFAPGYPDESDAAVNSQLLKASIGGVSLLDFSDVSQ